MLSISIDDKTSASALDQIAVLRSGHWTVVSTLLAARLLVPLDVIADEVLPRLWMQIREGFAAAICNPSQWPHSALRILKLSNRNKPAAMPNLCSAQWHPFWTTQKVSEATWLILRDRSAQVLLPDVIQRGKDGLGVHTYWMEQAGLRVSSGYGSRIEFFEDRFASVFGGSGWQTVW